MRFRPGGAAVVAAVVSSLASQARAEEKLHPVEGVAPPSSATALQDPKPEEPTSKPEPAKGPEERISDLEKGLRDAVRSALGGVRLKAMVDAAFTWNFADPKRRRDVNVYRVNDPDHDSFEFTWVKLGAGRPVDGEKNEWDAGFLVDFAAGREVQNTLSVDPGFLFHEPFNVAQAYVDFQAPTPYNPVLVRFGRMYSPFGIESLDTPTNLNYSMSYLNAFSPFTVTGVAVGMDLGAGFRYTQFVVNGWDHVIDNNNAKSIAGQLLWTFKEPATAIALNWIWGPERDDNNHDKRLLLELDATFVPIEGTELRAALQYGNEEGANVQTGGFAKFGGVEVIFRQELLEVREHFRRLAFNVRFTYYRDEGGALTGTDQALLEATATFELRFTEFAKLRLEYRHDQSTKEVFFGHSGPNMSHHQDTLSVDAAFAF